MAVSNRLLNLPHEILNGIFTYEQYLDSYVRDEDVYMLEDEVAARKLAELNLTTTKKILSKDKFTIKRVDIDTCFLQKGSLFTAGHCVKVDYEIKSVLMKELAMREELNRVNRLYSIIYIQDIDPQGHEMSGFIDFAHRLAKEDWDLYYQGKKKLRPSFKSDLSFYNFNTKKGYYNESPNFYSVRENDGQGLRFVCRRDKLPMFVDTRVSDPGKYTYMWMVHDPDFMKVLIYDHYLCL